MNKSKIFYLKDDEEVIISGKLLREHKKLVIKEFLDFHEFPESNIPGRMIINPYWLEHLLNLFFQGYILEVRKEIINTEMNLCSLIEKGGYGIIAKQLESEETTK